MNRFVAVIVVVCSSISALAQGIGFNTPVPNDSPTMEERMIEEIKNNALPVQFGAHFVVTNPQDSLSAAMSRLDAPTVGYGFNLYAAYNLDPVPVVLGGEFGMSFYGQTERTFYVPAAGGRMDTLSYTAQSLQYPINLFVRFQPNVLNWVFPYAEAVGGMRIYNSSVANLRTNMHMEDSQTTSDTDISWSYGIGLGMMVKLVDFVTLPNALQRFLLDVRCRYMWGSAVTIPRYNVDGNQNVSSKSVHVENPKLVEFSIGFAVQF